MARTPKSTPQKNDPRKKTGSPSVSARKKNASPAAVAVTVEREKTGEELVIENFAAVSRLVETMGETIELLTLKLENMAYHIIATEEVLAELVADNGISLPLVNTRIRQRISAGTDCCGDPSRAIDVAASIVSPLPRR